jgi:hypothetical protein
MYLRHALMQEEKKNVKKNEKNRLTSASALIRNNDASASLHYVSKNYIIFFIHSKTRTTMMQ